MRPRSENPRQILVVVPNWVGDVVMAGPALAALRFSFPDSRIRLLLRGYVRQVLDGCDWFDDVLTWSAARGLRRERENLDLVAGLRRDRPDMAVLLTNSFRSGLLTWLAGIPRRVGFARDGRGWMLTDKLRPLRRDGRYVPTSVVQSYCDLAERAGATATDRRLRLAVTDEQQDQAAAVRAAHGLPDGQPYAVLNPGAAFGAAKAWHPERFAAVARHLRKTFQLPSLVVGAPSERPLLERIAAESDTSARVCLDPGTSLGSLKPLIRDAAVLVCNDTGPRHYGIAFGTPTVTIFGPTHQAWTTSDAPREVALQAEVPCGPCQLRVCPLDHRCMNEITVEQVVGTIGRLLPVQLGEAAGSG